MAIALLRRLPLSIPTLSASLTPSAATATPSAKVSDRIVRLSTIDVDGNKFPILGLTGDTLLRALANTDLIDPASHRLDDIEACSGECEVHIAHEWLDKLPHPAASDPALTTEFSPPPHINMDL